MSDARPDLHRYTITSEGASKGYFRLVEDPEGCWMQTAEVLSHLAGVAAGAARPPTAEPSLRERRLEWVLDKAEELVTYNHGKDARQCFTEAWGELPKELNDPELVAASRPRPQEPGTGWLSRQIARTTRDMDDLPTWLGGRLDVDALREELRALRAASPPPQEGGPITLNVGQVNAARAWAADDRLWTTQNTVESNLQTFARLILKLAASPPPQEPDK